MIRILAWMFILAAISMKVMRAFDLQRLEVSLVLIIMGIFLYVISMVLTKKYITKKAPEFANDESWELTAGLGVVPKWVSNLGLIGIASFFTAIIPWIISLFQK
ncbi:MAG: hypothetical protein ISR95_07970 [Candidatus Marinimicrobia bacterium]|nr:hypothetical protein [Candidatus Neomarinimicrobiota bacterium]